MIIKRYLIILLFTILLALLIAACDKTESSLTVCETHTGYCLPDGEECAAGTFGWSTLGCKVACCLPDSSCATIGGYCEHYLNDCAPGYAGHTPMDCPEGRLAQCCVPTE